jgi:hypothetical protein
MITKESINVGTPSIIAQKENVRIDAGADTTNGKEEILVIPEQDAILNKNGIDLILGEDPINKKENKSVFIDNGNTQKASPSIILGAPVPVK